MPSVDAYAPFQAYRGDDKFVFVSYAHKDGLSVFPTISYLRDLGYRIWYDEGIDPGNEWPEDVAKALTGAAHFLVFISPNAVESHNVRNEINFALSQKKPFLAIHIVETQLPPGLELQMGSIQAIMRFRMSLRNYRRKLCSVLPASLRSSDEEQNRQVAQSVTKASRSMTLPVSQPIALETESDVGHTGVLEILNRVAEINVVLNWGGENSSIRVYLSKQRDDDIGEHDAMLLAQTLKLGGWDQEKVELGLIKLIHGVFTTSIGTVGFDETYPCGVYFERPYCEIELGFDRRISSLSKRDNKVSQIWVEIFRDHMQMSFGDDDGVGLDYDVSIGSLTIDFSRIFHGARIVIEAFGIEVLNKMGRPFLKNDGEGGEVICIPFKDSQS